MTRFLNGPAAGAVLMLRRAPMFLRAVQGHDGTWDALDQVEDTPAADETIVVYRRVTDPRYMHVNRGRRPGGGVFHGADYQLFDPAPADTDVRTTRAWVDWARARYEECKESA